MGENVLGIETKVVWATPGRFTIPHCNDAKSKNQRSSRDSIRMNNIPNGEDDKDHPRTCHPDMTQDYIDPSKNLQQIQRRLQASNPLLKGQENK